MGGNGWGTMGGMSAPTPAELLETLPLNTRVVVRSRIDGGFTDALGRLLACGDGKCTVETRRGPVVVALSDVVAAKRVPEPPSRRPAPPADS